MRGARWWRLTIVVAAGVGLLISNLGIEYFTAQSNLTAIAYFLTAVVVGWRRTGRTPAPRLRGAVTSWLLITAVANHFVLSSGADPLAFTSRADPTDWLDGSSNLLVHYVVPLMVLVDWIIWRPRVLIRWRDALLWMTFPILYLLVISARAALFPQILDRYPYSFLDPSSDGWPLNSALPAVVGVMVVTPVVVVAVEKILAEAGRRWASR